MAYKNNKCIFKKSKQKKNPKNKVIALIALLSARISQGHYYTGIY